MYQVDERRRRFESLVAEVHDPLTRYLRRRSTFADADDVLSEVLLTVWTRLDDVPAGAELPWSYGVARRALANHRRGEQRRLQLVRRIEAQPPVTYDPLGAEGNPDLAAALASLNDSEREVIALWAWEGLEPREIAAVLGTTPNAVSLRLGRAKKKVSERLRQNQPHAGHIDTEHIGAQTA